MDDDAWFGDNAAMETLEAELGRFGGWGAARNPRVREYVAREHLDGGVSIAQVARDHDLPISRIKKWVAVYQADGRAGLEALTDRTDT